MIVGGRRFTQKRCIATVVDTISMGFIIFGRKKSPNVIPYKAFPGYFNCDSIL